MRLLSLPVVACLLAVLPAMAQNAPAIETPQGDAGPVDALAVDEAVEETPTLADLLWIARPLVVFADTPNDPRFAQQMQMLQERTGDLDDRDVVILTDTDPDARGPLRRELRPRGFGIVLIDRDGSIVQRRPAPTTSREIINLIDRLPSRRQETGSRRQ
jgi:hypothetical protein